MSIIKIKNVETDNYFIKIFKNNVDIIIFAILLISFPFKNNFFSNENIANFYISIMVNFPILLLLVVVIGLIFLVCIIFAIAACFALTYNFDNNPLLSKIFDVILWILNFFEELQEFLYPFLKKLLDWFFILIVSFFVSVVIFLFFYFAGFYAWPREFVISDISYATITISFLLHHFNKKIDSISGLFFKKINRKIIKYL